MDVVRPTRQSVTAPLAVVIAILMALAFVAGVWYATYRIASATTPPQSAAAMATTLSPDAGDRNSGILAARLGMAEAAHGH